MKNTNRFFSLFLLMPVVFALESCQGKNTLIYDTTRIDSVTMKYYLSSQLQGTAVITDPTELATLITRYENVAVWTIPGNKDDPNLNINYAHGYIKQYAIDIHLAAKGAFQTESTYWMEFGYNPTALKYRFVTFSGYEYRYTDDYAESERLFLDDVYGAYAPTP
ncbi:MAG: hypothetical protein NTV44_03540 [Firmicutes bacterium]|nr:hypothetical protein [Bacillota bacterium]